MKYSTAHACAIFLSVSPSSKDPLNLNLLLSCIIVDPTKLFPDIIKYFAAAVEDGSFAGYVMRRAPSLRTEHSTIEVLVVRHHS